MAGRGRPPKPTAVKELEGNPGKRPLNKNEPKPKQIAPKCPSWLEPDAKKEWRRLSKELETMGLLTQVSIAQQNLKQMRNFCSELGLSPSARSRLNINNSGNTIEGDAMEELLSNVPKAEDILKKSKDD